MGWSVGQTPMSSNCSSWRHNPCAVPLEWDNVEKMEKLWDQPPGTHPVPAHGEALGAGWDHQGGLGVPLSPSQPCCSHGEGTGIQMQAEGWERHHKPRASSGGGARPAPTQSRNKTGSFPAKPAVGREIFAGAGASTAGVLLSLAGLRGWEQQPGCSWSSAGTQRVPRDSAELTELSRLEVLTAEVGNGLVPALRAQPGANFGKGWAVLTPRNPSSALLLSPKPGREGLSNPPEEALPSLAPSLGWV